MTSAFRTVLLTVAVAATFAMASPAALAAEYQITIANMRFGAPAGSLHVGDVIIWRNDDIFRHTATARDKSFDVDLPPKSERRMTVRQRGAIDFYCRFHPAMVGRLDVQR
ncbi:cupredoxin domain-containing protein [Rhizobium sullae]|uniref:Plastocyanin n=1 Tax=Rhizobium sullae TaxID=50338 RepID=A0A4V2V891_RHISU|nr:cupredoxin domain-containing protein [Rhizobium sullae]TCU11754.1 plastocyanin [Rhizobium sullae]